MNEIDYSQNPSGFLLRTQAPGASAVQMPGVPQMGMSPQGGAPDFNFFAQLAQKRMAEERRLRMAEEARRQEAHEAQLQAAAEQAQMGRQRDDFARDAARDAQNVAREQRDLANAKPSQFGRWQMNHTGNWGTFVDPANIPASLQGTIMGGMYGQAGNWDSSNPSITGPQQWNTGKYTKNASGAGSGGPGASSASIGWGGQGYDPNENGGRR